MEESTMFPTRVCSLIFNLRGKEIRLQVLILPSDNVK
jgi:hypothetical protein